jgi:CrcB protein
MQMHYVRLPTDIRGNVRYAFDQRLEADAMFASITAISAGASAGAILRWILSNRLNAVFPSLPLGTLAANLVGGYLIGIAVAYFLQHPSLSPEWRLFVITGFLGGLTTFSTFSAEVVMLAQRGEFGWALCTAALHLFGSLVLTIAGMATVSLIQGH